MSITIAKYGIANQPNVASLSRRLGWGAFQTLGALIAFHMWVEENAVDGDLSRFSAEDIAVGVFHFDGDSALLIDALERCGFVDRDGDRLILHDWDEYFQTPARTDLTPYEKKLARDARYREKRRAKARTGCRSEKGSSDDAKTTHDDASTTPDDAMTTPQRRRDDAKTTPQRRRDDTKTTPDDAKTTSRRPGQNGVNVADRKAPRDIQTCVDVSVATPARADDVTLQHIDDSKDLKDSKDIKESKDLKELKDSKDLKDPKDLKDLTDTQVSSSTQDAEVDFVTIDTAPYPLVPEIRYLLSYSGGDKLPKADLKELEDLKRRLSHGEITQLIDRCIAIFSQRGQPLTALTFSHVKKLAFHASHRAPPQSKPPPTGSKQKGRRVTSESYNSMMIDPDEYLKDHKEGG